jgi:D-3-phosphoglycerate dehydrogenase
MFKIQTLNKISSKGLSVFPLDQYEYASEIGHPDAILVRSQKMHDIALPETIKAIARAGAGVNNIPVDKCSEKGIIVFNTPGANANAVKELTIMSLLLSSRKVVPGILWAKKLIGKGSEVPKLVESGKSDYEGPEIKGKKLGIIGLGSIGVMVANDAHSMGMEVTGFDPFISIDAAWGLSSSIKKAPSLDILISDSDFISLHIPLNDKTRESINKDKFALMKKGVRILNFSRGELVNSNDMKDALTNGTVSVYVTDFPDEEMLKLENVIAIPHLGASTPESEENCAVMAVSQLMEFLEKGNIKNSVNFPECEMPLSGKTRLIIANKNIPNIIGQITHILAEEKLNIADMINKSKGDYAYNIFDLDLVGKKLDEGIISKLKTITGIIMARIV